jgi:hypothetical protein
MGWDNRGSTIWVLFSVLLYYVEEMNLCLNGKKMMQRERERLAL